MLALLLVVTFGVWPGGSQRPAEDPLLTDYYLDDARVTCRDFTTANGARLATYQWWLLGFVSGTRHASGVAAGPVRREEGSRLLAQAGEYCRVHPSVSLAAAARAVAGKANPRPAL